MSMKNNMQFLTYTESIDFSSSCAHFSFKMKLKQSQHQQHKVLHFKTTACECTPFVRQQKP